MQAKYSPQVKRQVQLDACEKLLMLIQPGKDYSFEFIRTTLTGYRPEITSRKSIEDENDSVLSYDTLINDLPAYSEQLSKMMELSSEKAEGKYYTVEGLAKKYKVCSKTVRRWRDKGLSGRYLSFPDGKQRLVFSQQMVNHFVRLHNDQVSRSSQFTRSSDSLKEQIIARLAKWSVRCPEYRQEAIRRISKRFGRSTETIRLILVQAEKDGLVKGFKKRSAQVDDELKGILYKENRAGKQINQLAKEYGRAPEVITQAINQEKARLLSEQEIFYIDNPEFHKVNAEADILGSAEDSVAGFIGNDPAMKDIPPGVLNLLEVYHNDLKKYQTLSAEKEYDLFRKYNFVKCYANDLMGRLDMEDPDSSELSHIYSCLSQSRKYKNKLIRHNLRLVVSTARKHARDDIQMSEYVSEGNLVLMNAVDKFDYARGFKFSTYATWAIVKRFATLKAALARRSEQIVFVADEILDIAHDLRCQGDQVSVLEQANMDLVKVMDEALDEREKNILCKHYGFVVHSEKSLNIKPLSLREVAELVGLSKERVRQIELQAIHKLRAVLSPEQFETLLRL